MKVTNMNFRGEQEVVGTVECQSYKKCKFNESCMLSPIGDKKKVESQRDTKIFARIVGQNQVELYCCFPHERKEH